MKIAAFLVSTTLLVACGSPRTEVAATAEPVPSASALAIAPAPPAPPASTPEPAAPAGPITDEQILMLNEGCKLRKSTNEISRCVAEPNAIGTWRPTKDEIAPALKLGGSLCYCADPIEKVVLTCMDRAKAPLVRVVIGKLDEPTDCGVSISTAEFGRRRFVRMLADDRDLATFYQVEVIAELTASGAVAYYEGFEPLTDAMVQGGGNGGEKGLSHQLRADWATLSPEMKRWLTTRP